MFFINEMTLLKGEAFRINKNIFVRHPTLNEVLDFGEEKYFDIVSLFCNKPYDYMVELADNGINWADKENFDVFLMAYNKERYSEGVNWLFGGRYFFQHARNEENGDLLLYDPVNCVAIDKLAFDQISSFLRRINFLSEKTEFTPANEIAREMVLEQKRKEMRRAERRPRNNESQLSTLISFLVWNNTNGMKIDDIFKLHLYQFHDGIARLLKTEYYRNIMLGYYTGNIAGKDIKFDVIDWRTKTIIE